MPINQSSQIITTAIGPGLRFPIYQAGTSFYLILATGPLSIKPDNASANQYSQGKGQNVATQFKNLELYNPSDNSIVFSLFVGFGGYIDNTSILYDPLVSRSIYPTAPIANVVSDIDIIDRSGQPIVDINGNSLLAISRRGIYFTNLDLATTYNIQNEDLTYTAIGIPPTTDIVFEASGNLKVHLPSSNINMIISEVYDAIEPSLQV